MTNDQSWFWTPRWQAMEAEVDEELAKGNYQVFDDMDEFLAELFDWEP